MVTNQFGTECPHFVIKTANDVILTKVIGSIICTECKNPETSNGRNSKHGKK